VGGSVAAAIVAGLGVWNQWGPRTEPPPAFLTADEACELLVSKELHQLFDGWAMRFQFVVWCNRNGQGDVAVTITPANGQEGRIDPALMKSQVEAEVGRVLARKGWEARLRQVSVQVLP